MIYFTVIVVNITAYFFALLSFEFYKDDKKMVFSPLLGVVMLAIATTITISVVGDEIRLTEYVYLKPMYQTWDYKGEAYETSHSLFQSK